MKEIYGFITDLDNTLIYSKNKISGDTVCIEKRNDEQLSFMKTEDYRRFCAVRKEIAVIPLTTRSLEQYRRINLFHTEIPKLALVANGGILLVDGEVDAEWYQESKSLIAGAAEQIRLAEKLLDGSPERNFDIRNIDELFLFTKSEDANKTYDALIQKLDLSLVSVCINLKKVYVLPKILDKGLAVRRLRERYSLKFLIGAGDSSFDEPMLEQADIAIGIKGRYQPEKQGQKVLLWDGNEFEFAEFVLNQVTEIIKAKEVYLL